MIRGDSDVRFACLHHAEERTQDTTHRRNLTAFAVPHRRKGMELPEQLVGAVDQLHFHNEGYLGSVSRSPSRCS